MKWIHLRLENLSEPGLILEGRGDSIAPRSEHSYSRSPASNTFLAWSGLWFFFILVGRSLFFLTLTFFSSLLALTWSAEVTLHSKWDRPSPGFFLVPGQCLAFEVDPCERSSY